MACFFWPLFILWLVMAIHKSFDSVCSREIPPPSFDTTGPHGAAHPLQTPAVWGCNNCMMACSLSGSGQAQGVFSQSRHLLCCPFFGSDVMSNCKSRPHKLVFWHRGGTGVGLWSGMVWAWNKSGFSLNKQRKQFSCTTGNKCWNNA